MTARLPLFPDLEPAPITPTMATVRALARDVSDLWAYDPDHYHERRAELLSRAERLGLELVAEPLRLLGDPDSRAYRLEGPEYLHIRAETAAYAALRKLEEEGLA